MENQSKIRGLSRKRGNETGIPFKRAEKVVTAFLMVR